MSHRPDRGMLKRILSVALPVSLEFVFQMSFNAIDQIIVGFLGAAALAGVGFSNSLASMAILLATAFGTGSGALIARAFGRKDMDAVSRTASIAQALACSLGVIVALPIAVFSRPLLISLGAHEDVAELGDGYFRLFLAALPLIILSTVTSAAFRSLNDAKTPMLITIGAVILNTLLAFVLVLGCGPFPRLGVIGAGLATLISQLLRCIVLLCVFYRHHHDVHWVWPLPSVTVNSTLIQMIKLTAPIAASELSWGASGFIYTLVFIHIGTTSLAASQITMALENIFIVVSAGLGPAALVVVGQQLGTRSVTTAKKHANVVLLLGLATSIVLGLLFASLSLLVRTLYPNVGDEVLQLVFWAIIILAIIQPAKVLNGIFGNGLLATGGDTRYILLINFIGTYGVGLPLAIFLGLFARLGFYGVIIGKIADELIKLVCFLVRYRTPAWYRRSLKAQIA
jgi:putative MATE family efflux protein